MSSNSTAAAQQQHALLHHQQHGAASGAASPPTSSYGDGTNLLPAKNENGLDTRLLNVLARIESKVDVLNYKVDNLERRMEAFGVHISMPLDDDSYGWEELPVRSQHELDMLEEKLKHDSYYKAQLERRLMLIGGDSLRSCVKRTLEVLLAHEVQLLFNWAGTVGRRSKEQKPKLAFKNTELCPIITRVVVRTSEGSTEDLIHKEVMLYLRGCADRCGGRQRRLQKMSSVSHNIIGGETTTNDSLVVDLDPSNNTSDNNCSGDRTTDTTPPPSTTNSGSVMSISSNSMMSSSTNSSMSSNSSSGSNNNVNSPSSSGALSNNSSINSSGGGCSSSTAILMNNTNSANTSNNDSGINSRSNTNGNNDHNSTNNRQEQHFPFSSSRQHPNMTSESILTAKATLPQHHNTAAYYGMQHLPPNPSQHHLLNLSSSTNQHLRQPALEPVSSMQIDHPS